MRRKKNDKRVLTGIPDNDRRAKQSLKSRHRRQPVPVRQRKQKKNVNKTLIILMIIALAAFVVGAGLGVSIGLDNGEDTNATPQYENVTIEMTSNLNETEEIYFDSELDGVDFNDQQDMANLNLTNNTTTLNY